MGEMAALFVPAAPLTRGTVCRRFGLREVRYAKAGLAPADDHGQARYQEHH